MRGTFLQTEAHSDKLWLVYPRVLEREEGRHARVTSGRSDTRRSSSVCSQHQLQYVLDLDPLAEFAIQPMAMRDSSRAQ
jgi:hypothetical protein